jgi:hypothetical protein
MVGGASQGILSSLEDVLGGRVANTEHGKVKRQHSGSLQRGLNPLQADAVSVADLLSALATRETYPCAFHREERGVSSFSRRRLAEEGPDLRRANRVLAITRVLFRRILNSSTNDSATTSPGMCSTYREGVRRPSYCTSSCAANRSALRSRCEVVVPDDPTHLSSKL